MNIDYDKACSMIKTYFGLKIHKESLHTFRIPKPVTKVRIYRDRNMYAVCPRCDNAMEYEYQLYCNHCGQHLEWSKYDEAEEEYIGWNSTEDDEDDEEDGDSDY
ncbi:MAG: hypothetical protein BHV93_15205 [Clostridiales bacterium 52_15]|nr:MAG: hypothetical protein BHV93_15205 [Clostridiales bacterium 52_15]